MRNFVELRLLEARVNKNPPRDLICDRFSATACESLAVSLSHSQRPAKGCSPSLCEITSHEASFPSHLMRNFPNSLRVFRTYASLTFSYSERKCDVAIQCAFPSELQLCSGRICYRTITVHALLRVQHQKEPVELPLRDSKANASNFHPYTSTSQSLQMV